MLPRLKARPIVSAVAAAFAMIAASAQAEIDYRVKVNPTDKRLEVTVTIPVRGSGPLTVQLPNWSPGAYALHRSGETAHDMNATGSDGKPLTFTQPNPTTWTFASPGSGNVTLTYWVPTGGGGMFGRGGGDPSFVQMSGPSTYIYVVDRKKERCKVTFDVPKGWPVLVGLDATAGPENTYGAPTYDVLADNPMSTGDILIDHYSLRGKDHYIVLEGAAKSQVNREKLLKDCRFVSSAETDFWGGAPYHKYVWHFTVFPGVDGAGGLEHLSSTQIGLSSGEGPLAQSVLSHEYFHLWNVKRIRSRVLGPFDYTKLPRTGALWWLEGVTDYYAWLLPYRYGEWELPMFYNGIVRNMSAIANNPARLTVSPNDASLRVGDAEGGRGNSNGYQISYYNLGWLCGLCLDTEIRAQSHGKHSLDDVAHALFQLCKNDKPGFEEGEIRKQCIRFGGPSLGPFYDKVVMTPGELPIAEQLAKMGLKLDSHDETFVDAQFTAAPSRAPGGGVVITNARGTASGPLHVRDTVKSINGNELAGKSPMDIMAIIRNNVDNAKVGTPIALVLVRDGETFTASIDPVSATRKVNTVIKDPAATPEAIALGEQWLARKTAAVQ